MTKIMLVEDDKSLREIYGVRLLAEGYEIISAGNGEEALAMAVKEHPDLILSDVMMPKISGFDMLDILRATPETKDLKVIMMTALSSEDQRERGEKLGADRYLVKSQVGIEDVVRSIHDVLADVPAISTPAVQKFGLPIESAAIKPGTTTPTISEPVVELSQPTIKQPAAAPTQTQTTNPVINAALTTSEEIPSNPTPQMPTQTVDKQTSQEGTPIPTQNETSSPSPPAVTSHPSTSVKTPTTSQAPQTTPAPVAPVQLPQPTAPFSSPAPASLGDRIINPISKPEEQPDMDIATMMSQELDDGSTTNPTPKKSI